MSICVYSNNFYSAEITSWHLSTVYFLKIRPEYPASSLTPSQVSFTHFLIPPSQLQHDVSDLVSRDLHYIHFVYSWWLNSLFFFTDFLNTFSKCRFQIPGHIRDKLCIWWCGIISWGCWGTEWGKRLVIKLFSHLKMMQVLTNVL